MVDGKTLMMACEEDWGKPFSTFYFNYDYLCLVVKLYWYKPCDKIGEGLYDDELEFLELWIVNC